MGPLLPRAALVGALACSLAASLLGAATPAVADDDADGERPLYTCMPAAPTTRMHVSFKPDVSVADLGVWVAGFTCENVIIGPEVAKHATRLQVITPAPMTPKQAVKLFVSTLEAAGLKVKHKDRTFTVTLGPGTPRGCPDVAAAVDGPGGAPVVVGAPTLDIDRLSDKIADGVRTIDASHVEVPRALFDELVANPTAFARGARVLPSFTDGIVKGVRFYAVRPGSLVARAGLANGDTVTAVNGLPLDTADHALDAYTSLRGASRVEVSIVRRGKPFTLTVTIVP